MYLVISHRQAINQLMFSSQLSSFLLSAARVLERSSHLVFGFLASVCNDKSVKSPEVPAPMKKKGKKKRFLWQTLCCGRHASFFDDQRQNSINWPRLLRSTGRQSSITPGGCTRISFCSSCQLNAFPSHKRHFSWGRAAWFFAVWLLHDIMHKLCPSKKDSDVFLSRGWGRRHVHVSSSGRASLRATRISWGDTA